MGILEIVIAVFLAALTVAVGYLYLLAAVGILLRKRYPELKAPGRFLVLVPAHNEENGIAPTVRSLRQMEHAGQARIVVIADNCTDRTAEIAKENGAEVLERTDEEHRGKGYALEWALAGFDLNEFDAVAIVDADTLVDADMLETMSRSFAAGAGAVQCNYLLTASGSRMAYLLQMANAAENIFFYKARAVCRLPVLLRGTGMAVRSAVLQQWPMDSHSITEDVDYAVKLLTAGVRIDYAIDSAVRSPATTSYGQAESQRTRWAAGTFSLIRDKALPLIGKGIRRGRPDLVELAFSLMLLSRPTLIYLTLIPLVLSLFLAGGDRLFALGWSAVLILLLVIYLVAGIFFVKEKAATLVALVHAPFYILWLMWVQVKALFKRRELGWERTDRESDG